MSKEQNKMQEMSVEEILDSIRRVIGGENKEQPSATYQAQNARDEDDEEILELTNPVPASAPKRVDAFSPDTREVAENISYNTAIIEPQIAHKTAEHINELVKAKKVTAQNNAEQQKPRDLLLSKSVEDLVIMLLKPQLKTWLDKNLPDLVETIVKQELKELTDKIR